MNNIYRHARVLVSLFVLLSITWIPEARANAWDRTTFFSIDQPVRIPGKVVLPPGKYAMELLDIAPTRNVVQIKDAARTRVYATMFALPEMLSTPAPLARLELGEATKGSIEEMKAWYYPGSMSGLRFQ